MYKCTILSAKWLFIMAEIVVLKGNKLIYVCSKLNLTKMQIEMWADEFVKMEIEKASLEINEFDICLGYNHFLVWKRSPNFVIMKFSIDEYYRIFEVGCLHL